MKKTGDKTSGFTIVELLTVMGVIAVLIGLLVPALNMVKDFAKEIQQKAQFHSIDVGLEMFKKDFGNYPESKDNGLAPPNQIDPTIYCGANKLAEAMVGWDLLGFHPKSGFTASGFNNIDSDLIPEFIYATTAPGLVSSDGTYTETPTENIDSRLKYIDLENANAYKMEDIYQAYAPFFPGSFTLCDVYAERRHSGKKTGMPILYFRARAAFKFQDYNAPGDPGDDNPGTNNDTYNWWDNSNLLALGLPEDGAVPHPLYDTITDLVDFEEIILNRQVQEATLLTAPPDGIKRSYRDDSFILMSAGKDGLYGTADDLYNFAKEVE